jgi:hypothetical protein
MATSSDRSETSLFGGTFIAALRSRLISAITAMRAIPWRESIRSWIMRFSANMTNDDQSVKPMEVKLDRATLRRHRA